MHNISLIGDFSFNYMNELVDIEINFRSNPFYTGGEFIAGSTQCGFNGILKITSDKTWGEICGDRQISPLCLQVYGSPLPDPGATENGEYIIGMFLPYNDIYDHTNDYSISCNMTISARDNRQAVTTTINNFNYFTKKFSYGGFPLWVRCNLTKAYDLSNIGNVQLDVQIRTNAPVLEMKNRYTTVNNVDIFSNNTTLNDLMLLNFNTDYNVYLINKWNYSWYRNRNLQEQQIKYINYKWSEKYPPESYLYRVAEKTYSYYLHVAKNIKDLDISSSDDNIVYPPYEVYGDIELNYIAYTTNTSYEDNFIITPILFNTNIPIFKNKVNADLYKDALKNNDTSRAIELLKRALNYDQIKQPTINNLLDVNLNGNIPNTTTNNVYLLTETQFNNFVNELYNDNIWDVIVNDLFGRNLIENVINVRSYAIDLSPLSKTTTNVIKFCNYNMDINGVQALNDYVLIIDCGTVFLNRIYNNFYDYQPYTSISLYLPFYGILELDCYEYMDSEIGVKYSVDVITGYAVITILKNGTIVESVTTNISYNISFSASNYTEYMRNIINTATKTVGDMVTSNYGGLVSDSLNIAFPQTRLKAITSGLPSATSNLTLPQFPYVYIRHHIFTAVENEQTVYGYPSNTIGRIGDFSGFLKCAYVDIAGLPLQAHQNIYAMLKDGIYI